VPLAPVSSAEHLVPAIADTLGFPFDGHQNPKEQLLNYLREREMLLVLDNIEHVLEGVGLLAEVLERAPGVVLLVTSRERLNLREEWVYTVEGLTYPEDGPMDGLALSDALSLSKGVAEGLETFSAVNLFQQRARQAHRHFALSETEIPHVVRICQLVEGMPLGIELAAAWAAVRSGAEIAQEIECNLDILTTSLRNVPARQRSVRATFEYSWHLLTEMEKDIFSRLSVFRGGFRREAAAVVAGTSPLALSALLDKSLIRHVSPDRYDVHEQHARHFAAFLEQLSRHLQGAKQKQALTEIGLEVENARQAWQLAVARGNVHQVEQSLESLYHFCDIQSRFQEGVELFAQAIDRWSGDTQQARIFGKALSRQGALHRSLGHYQQARAFLEQSLVISERLKTRTEQIFCLVNLVDVARRQGRYEEAEQLAQKSLALSRQIGDTWGATSSLFLLGLVRYRTGDVAQAQALLEESLAIGRESGNRRLVISPLNTLGDLACHQGDYARARTLFEECLALSRELGDQFKVAMHLNNLGTVLHVLDKYAEAQPFYRESLEICRQICDRAGQAIALSNLGEVAYALGGYPDAIEFYQQGLSIGRDIQDQRTVITCLNNLGEITCALEDYEGANVHFAEALKVTTEARALPMLIKVLVNLAVLFAKQGQRDRAAALLGLARQHPASEQAIQERAERLLDEMGLIPPDSAPSPLDVVVAEMLAEISPS
jgi:predicted ATPase